MEQCWDYRPPQDKIDAEPGWQEAVEIMPDVLPNREVITTHVFDVTKAPVEIVWSKREISVEERKSTFKSLVKTSFDNVVKAEVAKEVDELLDTHYDAAVVEAARQAYMSRLAEINAMTTHDELDAFQQSIGR